MRIERNEKSSALAGRCACSFMLETELLPSTEPTLATQRMQREPAQQYMLSLSGGVATQVVPTRVAGELQVQMCVCVRVPPRKDLGRAVCADLARLCEGVTPAPLRRMQAKARARTRVRAQARSLRACAQDLEHPKVHWQRPPAPHS